MYDVLFYYTLTIMLIVTIAAATSVSAYFVSHRKSFAFAAATMLSYFFDVALVFQHDFVAPNIELTSDTFWDISNPAALTVTGGFLLAFLWLTVCQFIGEKRAVAKWAPTVLYLVWSVGSLFLFSEPRVREFIFFSGREAALFLMAALIAVRYRTADKESAVYNVMHKYCKRFLVCLGIVVLITLENVYMQLVFDPETANRAFRFFAERSFAENLLFVVLAVSVMRACSKELQLRYEKPPARDDEMVEDSIDRVLPRYVEMHGLSKRESEVLRLIVLGKDNQNIASELTLAPSTVKVHVHNILKKTDQANRGDLIRDFWGA